MPCGDEAPFRIDRDGRWHYLGSPIGRIALVKLFATVLRREADGSYWLATPVERVRIAVDDVPFVAVELQALGAAEGQLLRLRSNLDQWVEVGPLHPLQTRAGKDGVPVPYVEFRPSLDARLARPVYYELVDRGVERDLDGRRRFGVWSGGAFFPLGTLEG